jgi:hypothetical protein
MEIGCTGQAVLDDTRRYRQQRHISCASRKGNALTVDSTSHQKLSWNALRSFQSPMEEVDPVTTRKYFTHIAMMLKRPTIGPGVSNDKD